MYCAGHYTQIHRVEPSQQRACPWLPPAVRRHAQGAPAAAAAAPTIALACRAVCSVTCAAMDGCGSEVRCLIWVLPTDLHAKLLPPLLAGCHEMEQPAGGSASTERWP